MPPFWKKPAKRERLFSLRIESGRLLGEQNIKISPGNAAESIRAPGGCLMVRFFSKKAGKSPAVSGQKSPKARCTHAKGIFRISTFRHGKFERFSGTPGGRLPKKHGHFGCQGLLRGFPRVRLRALLPGATPLSAGIFPPGRDQYRARIFPTPREAALHHSEMEKAIPGGSEK